MIKASLEVIFNSNYENGKLQESFRSIVATVRCKVLVNSRMRCSNANPICVVKLF
jgi:hypothetical protein